MRHASAHHKRHAQCNAWGVYQLTVRLTSCTGKTREMIQALRLVMLPAEVEPGFMGCQIYSEASEAESLCFQAEWATQADLEREIRSARFGRLLAVMETSAGSPTLEVRLIAETRGWKYVRELRGEVDAANGGNGHAN